MKKLLILNCSILVVSIVIGFSNWVFAEPDLFISEFTLKPSAPVQGERVSVRIGVYNKGTTPLGDFTLAWHPGENYKHPGCTWRVHKINARGGKIFNCTYFYPSWYAKITTMAVADIHREVREQDESNNIRRMAIKVLKP